MGTLKGGETGINLFFLTCDSLSLSHHLGEV